MHRTQCCFYAEHDDEPFNLAPPAKLDMVADVTAGFGAVSGFDPGGLAVCIYQSLRLDDIALFDIQGQIHARSLLLK